MKHKTTYFIFSPQNFAEMSEINWGFLLTPPPTEKEFSKKVVLFFTWDILCWWNEGIIIQMWTISTTIKINLIP